MTAFTIDSLSGYRGKDKTVGLTLQYSSGDPVDITGYTFYLTVKEDRYEDDTDDSNAIIKKTVTSHIDPTNGITSFVFTDEDMDIEPKNYFYDISYKDTDDKFLPVGVGLFRVRTDVTRVAS